MIIYVYMIKCVYMIIYVLLRQRPIANLKDILCRDPLVCSVSGNKP